MTDYYEGKSVLGIELPERAFKILQAEAERLGLIHCGKGNLRLLMHHYAMMYRDHPEKKKRIRSSAPRRWQGAGATLKAKQIWLPTWARTSLRRAAGARGLIHAKGMGDVNALLQDHAANLSKMGDDFQTVDEWRVENTPLP